MNTTVLSPPIGGASLPEVHRTVAVPRAGVSRATRALAFAGPGYLVAVGYMAVSYTHLTLPTILRV